MGSINVKVNNQSLQQRKSFFIFSRQHWLKLVIPIVIILGLFGYVKYQLDRQDKEFRRQEKEKQFDKQLDKWYEEAATNGAILYFVVNNTQETFEDLRIAADDFGTDGKGSARLKLYIKDKPYIDKSVIVYQNQIIAIDKYTIKILAIGLNYDKETVYLTVKEDQRTVCSQTRPFLEYLKENLGSSGKEKNHLIFLDDHPLKGYMDRKLSKDGPFFGYPLVDYYSLDIDIFGKLKNENYINQSVMKFFEANKIEKSPNNIFNRVGADYSATSGLSVIRKETSAFENSNEIYSYYIAMGRVWIECSYKSGDIDKTYKEISSMPELLQELNKVSGQKGLSNLIYEINDFDQNIIEGNIINDALDKHIFWLQKKNGIWEKLYEGQDLPSCNFLENLQIAGAHCIDKSSEDNPFRVSYSMKIENNDLKYTLPPGWTAKKEIITLDFETKPKRVLITAEKGNYKLKIGGLSSGGVRCDYYYNHEKYLTIENKTLGNIVVRQEPEVDTNKQRAESTVCSTFQDDKNYIALSTIIGKINYILPLNWDQQTLDEMDSIVASLKK